MSKFWDDVEKKCKELKELETPEACESHLALVSVRPQPGTPMGDVWEAGFRYAWGLRNRFNS